MSDLTALQDLPGSVRDLIEHRHQARRPEQTRLAHAGRTWLAHLLTRL
ncbi:hypothetical protein [Micrococcus endophyticus]